MAAEKLYFQLKDAFSKRKACILLRKADFSAEKEPFLCPYSLLEFGLKRDLYCRRILIESMEAEKLPFQLYKACSSVWKAGFPGWKTDIRGWKSDFSNRKFNFFAEKVAFSASYLL
jgi:hypothetical protein